MKVHEIMTAHARRVAPDTTLVEAAGLMRETDVGALPVVDTDRLAGIVTDRDIVVRGVADGVDPGTARVSQVMSGGIEAVAADDSVEDAARIMERHQIRRLPVVDASRRLVGMVSLGDISLSSNPAFGGMALRNVSEPAEPSARQRRLARQSEPVRAPRGPAAAGRVREAGDRRSVQGGRKTSASRKKTRGRQGTAAKSKRAAGRR